MKKIEEDAPMNAAGSGAVAGLDSNPPGPSTILSRLRRKQPAVQQEEPKDEPQGPDMKTLYVHRNLRNADDLIQWAKEQGFNSVIPAEKMHTTIAFSKGKVDWHSLAVQKDTIAIPSGKRSVQVLGDQGAIVLRFESDKLQQDWQNYRAVGATWDFDGYHPHVTITFEGFNGEYDKIIPYDGVLLFGPEIVEELNLKWKSQIKEIDVDNTGPTQ